MPVARQSPIGYLFENHDALFVTNNDRDFMILIVFIMYEKLKGEDSFYHPYFAIVDDDMIPTCYWPETVLERSDI